MKKNREKHAGSPAEETAEETVERAAAANETAEEGTPAQAAEEGTPAEEAPAQPSAEEALQKAQAEAEDFKRKWYSVTAEYENYRRRTQYQSAQRYQDGRADVVSKLFPIGDNLARAIDACNDDATRKGIEMVMAAFRKVLEEEKIEEIYPLGEPFDAEKCEAIMAVEPAEGEESGTVRQVYRKGYEQNGKVLRFAQVVVVK